MTLNDLRGSYRVVPHSKGYAVYSQHIRRKRFGFKYLAFILKEGPKFKVDSDKYDFVNTEALLTSQIDDYVANLDFDSDYYNPLLRDGSFEELITHDSLISWGFTHLHGDTYSLKNTTLSNPVTLVITVLGLSSYSKDISMQVASDSKYKWHEIRISRYIYKIMESLESIVHLFYGQLLAVSLENLNKFKLSPFTAKTKAIADSWHIIESSFDKQSMIDSFTNSINILKNEY